MENNTIHERKNNIPVKNITLKQTPETDEALLLLHGKQQYLKWALFATAVSFGLSFFISVILVLSIGTVSAGLIIFFILVTVVTCAGFFYIFNKRSAMLRPYYELLRIAQKNDDLRHEERIRWRERKRLEKEEKFLPELKLRKVNDKKMNEIEERETANLQKIQQTQAEKTNSTIKNNKN